jgi:uncharacterized protein (TIGR02996 family)
MSDDEAALIRMIRENPADDLPRLVYADWLEEHNKENRADFIRQGVMAASTPPPCLSARGLSCYTCDYCKSQKYCDDFHRDPNLWKLVHSEFDPENRMSYAHCDGPQHLPRQVEDFKWLTLYTARGFIAAVSCTMAEWEKHGPAICARHPVERVEITDKEPHIDSIGVWWHHQDASPTRNLLPDSFYSAVKNTGILQSHRTITDAKNWLSDRCIEWTVEQAEGGRATTNGITS